jgi:hypothetical protein
MDEINYSIRISPEVISNDIFFVKYVQGEYSNTLPYDPCCDVSGQTISGLTTGYTFVYKSMSEILSGGTDGASILTGLTIPIYLSETAVDIGFYDVFDGLITQKDVMINFLFSADTLNPYVYYFFNTSDIEFKKFLEFCDYQINWGDGSPIQVITSVAPNYYSHTYSQDGEYQISMSGMSPWGYNVIEKTIYVPFTDVVIDNPYGTAFFIPAGGSWSNTPLMYDYIFTGDSICETETPCCEYGTIPFLVTGYTFSSMGDLQVYGKKSELDAGKYKMGYQVTGSSGSVGVWWGPSFDGSYTSYTLNDITYYDYSNGQTVFIVESSGCTYELLCSAITKNEVLLNVISEPEVQSNVFIERGKNSALEYVERLGEVNNMGSLMDYGYRFFNVIKI